MLALRENNQFINGLYLNSIFILIRIIEDNNFHDYKYMYIM